MLAYYPDRSSPLLVKIGWRGLTGAAILCGMYAATEQTLRRRTVGASVWHCKLRHCLKPYRGVCVLQACSRTCSFFIHHRTPGGRTAPLMSTVQQQYQRLCYSKTTPHTTTILRPFFWDHPGEPVPEENFWTLWCKGRLTEADTLTIWLGATPSGLISAHLHHPPHFSQAGCHSCRPTNSVKTLKAKALKAICYSKIPQNNSFLIF